MRQYFDPAKLDVHGNVLETRELDRVDAHEALKVAIEIYDTASAAVVAYWYSQEHPDERHDYSRGAWSAEQVPLWGKK